ncbi:SDR family oxidoreductase [Lactobacillus hamsteri]|uniref:Oxidoreductase n=1 Tax=Lactobacillus hamsteri DSM 5661 = JCM 6256 TaxID=1423754 RepID=A0A0R1Y7S7_9LACO|nr:NAD(P)H-binding protein [Lactobacillus hamsteri]KRM38488.1 oxidoreductase [Lactobacillus hamsteri DSM 5661 = JCM 6256]
MKNVIIFAANGQISRLVEERLLANDPDINLTLFLRNSQRLAELANNNDRVTLVDGNLDDTQAISDAMKNQDIAFIGVVDHESQNTITKNVIAGAKTNGVKRIIECNVLGIYDEVPNEFGRWNAEMIGEAGLRTARNADKLLEESGIDYTTLRLPWLNDRNDLNYTITHKDEEYVGVSGSRKSMADVVVKIIENPDYLKNDSVGIADLTTQGSDRPVY